MSIDKMKRLYIKFLIKAVLLTLVFSAHANNDVLTLKIALLDSPNNMPHQTELWTRYEKSYFSGIETAAYTVKKSGFKIQYKNFFYGIDPLDILNQVPEVKKWQPDLVIGPHYSNQFLLLKNYFPDTLVLSTYASAVDMVSLPKNFYSLSLPDINLVKAMNYFIQSNFTKRNIFIIAQGDCRQCIDMKNEFISSNEKKIVKVKTAAVTLLLENNNTVNFSKLISGHEQDVIVLLAATYYGYADLVNRIYNATRSKHLVFVTDVDNWGGDADSRILFKNIKSYDNYRFVSPAINKNSYKYKEFEKAYKDLFKSNTPDEISYQTYLTVISVVRALQQFPVSEKLSMQKRVLQSYLIALKKNKNWFRSTLFYVNKLTPQGEVLFQTIPTDNLGEK